MEVLWFKCKMSLKSHYAQRWNFWKVIGPLGCYTYQLVILLMSSQLSVHLRGGICSRDRSLGLGAGAIKVYSYHWLMNILSLSLPSLASMG